MFVQLEQEKGGVYLLLTFGMLPRKETWHGLPNE